MSSSKHWPEHKWKKVSWGYNNVNILQKYKKGFHKASPINTILFIRLSSFFQAREGTISYISRTACTGFRSTFQWPCQTIEIRCIQRKVELWLGKEIQILVLELLLNLAISISETLQINSSVVSVDMGYMIHILYKSNIRSLLWLRSLGRMQKSLKKACSLGLTYGFLIWIY